MPLFTFVPLHDGDAHDNNAPTVNINANDALTARALLRRRDPRPMTLLSETHANGSKIIFVKAQS